MLSSSFSFQCCCCCYCHRWLYRILAASKQLESINRMNFSVLCNNSVHLYTQMKWNQSKSNQCLKLVPVKMSIIKRMKWNSFLIRTSDCISLLRYHTITNWNGLFLLRFCIYVSLNRRKILHHPKFVCFLWVWMNPNELRVAYDYRIQE